MDQKYIYRFLSAVRKPSRYIGNEINTSLKTGANLFNGILTGADTYDRIMPLTDFRRLYTLLNKSFKADWGRVFLPEKDAAAYLSDKGLSLFTLEKFLPLREADALLFYIADPRNLLNLPLLLELADIAWSRKEREKSDPLILAAGPGIVNPAPFTEVFDAVFWGEWEAFVKLFERTFIPSFDKGGILENLAAEESVIVPDKSGGKKYFAVTEKLNASLYPAKLLLPRGTGDKSLSAVELAKGSFSPSRFSAENFILRPLRQRRVEDIVTEIKNRHRYNGERVFRLYSPALEEYEQLPGLLKRLKTLAQEEKISFHIEGLLFDPAEETPEIFKGLSKHRFKLPLYTADEDSRRMLNLSVPLNVLEKMFVRLVAFGWEHFVIEALIGVPKETDESLILIADWINGLQKHVQGKPQTTFRIKLTPFLPQPFSPLQWAETALPDELERKAELLKSKVKLAQCSWDIPDFGENILKGIILRGDEHLVSDFLPFLKESDGMDFNQLSEKNRDKLSALSLYDDLPWSGYQVPVSNQHLKNEWLKSLSGEITYDCGTYKCYQCGVQRAPYGERTDCYKIAAEHPLPEKYQYILRKFSEEQAKAISYGRGAKRRDSSQQQIIKKLRIKYSKKGLGAFLSQTDVGGDFEKAAKIAGFPLAFTQGKIPKPKISYGLSLPSGYESEAEYFDVEALVLKEADMLGKINRMMPVGIVILEAKAIFRKIESLANSVTVVTYLMKPLTERGKEALVSIAEELRELFAQEELILTDAEKEIDLRAFWIDLNENPDSLRFVFRVDAGKTIKPHNLLRLCKNFDYDFEDFAFIRTGQFIKKDDTGEIGPMDVL